MSKHYGRSVSARALGATAFALVLLNAPSARGSEETWVVAPIPAIEAPRPRQIAAPNRGALKRRWIASWVLVAAVNALDIQSSLGHGEANPLYRGSNGRFAAGKALAVKSAISGGFFLSQLLLVHSGPEKKYYKPFTWTNVVTAGALGGVVVHNYSLQRPQHVAERAVPSHLAPQP